MELKDRKDIDEKYKFDLTEYCKDEQDFYDKLEKFKSDIKKIPSYKGRLSDPDTLLEFEEFSDKLDVDGDVLMCYAMFLKDVDSSNISYQKMYTAIYQVMVEMQSLASFVDEEMQTLGEEYLNKIIADPRFDSRKLSYQMFIKNLSHVLNERESYFVSQMQNFSDFQSIFEVVLDNELKFDKVADSKGELHDLSVSLYSKYLRSDDRVLRENAYKAFSKGMSEHKLTLFSCVHNALKEADFLNKLQKYNGVLEKQLDGYEMSKDVFDKIIAKARENVGIRYRYQMAQATGLGLEKMEPWDSIVAMSKSEQKVDFDSAVDIMRGAFKHLGKTYEDAFVRAISEKWCDIYPNRNKRSAIYCGGSHNRHPVLHFNWQDNADDMLTFAHEFGHAVQFLLTDKAQPICNSSLPFVVVEVPSLTSETVMFRYLYDSAQNDDEKLLYLQSMIQTFNANVNGGCMDAEHEYFMRKCIQEGKLLDIETASDKEFELRKFYSSLPAYDYSKYNWLSDGHIFVTYYNYMYSLSMIVAVHFAKGCYEGNEQVRQNFYKFMQTGYSKHPLENLKECGVDLLDDKLYNEAFEFFDKLVTEFETLVEKRQK